MAYDAYDEDRRRPGRQPHRSSYSYNYNLNTTDPYRDPARGRSRSRSSPSRGPDINIYNDIYADNDIRAQQQPPSPSFQDLRGRQMYNPYNGYAPPMMMPGMMPGGMMPVMPVPVGGPAPQQQGPPQQRPRSSRSSSSSHSHHSHSRHRHGSESYWLQEAEIAKQDAARKAAIAEFKREHEEHERAVQAAIEAHEVEEARKAKEKKDAEKEAVRKWQEEQKEKEKKEKEIAEEYERKKKEKKKKEDDEYKERMAKDLARYGFRENQVEAIVDHKDEKRPRAPSNTALVLRPAANAVLPKIKRTDIALETLNHYKLPWAYDETDGDYIIIQQEMTVRETDVLFKHTAKLRERGTATMLGIEARRGRNGDPQLAVVRKRSKSRGKSPSRPERFVEKFLLR